MGIKQLTIGKCWELSGGQRQERQIIQRQQGKCLRKSRDLGPFSIHLVCFSITQERNQTTKVAWVIRAKNITGYHYIPNLSNSR